MNLDYSNICQSAIIVVKETASFIQNEVGRVDTEQIEDKDRNSLVSYVDKTAESKLVKGLSVLIPEAVFLTEEDTVENQEGKIRWIIDPLDGTTNFLHQIPVFSISVALEVEQELVVGIVYEVNRSECFYAWKDGGAFLNDQTISVKEEAKLSNGLIATGWPFRNFELLPPYLNALQLFLQNARGIRRLGSAAVDLAYVACGRFDGYFEQGLHPWDAAAGIVLVQEAGGKVSDFKGANDYLYGQEMVASNGHIHGQMLSIIQGTFKIE